MIGFRHYHGYRYLFKSPTYTIRQCHTCGRVLFQYKGTIVDYFKKKEAARWTPTHRHKKNPKLPKEHPYIVVQKRCPHEKRQTVIIPSEGVAFIFCKECGMTLSAGFLKPPSHVVVGGRLPQAR